MTVFHGRADMDDEGIQRLIDAAGIPLVISDHFKTEEHVVKAPFDGFLAGILANPRVLPGHPFVHLVEITDEDREHVRRSYEDVGFARHGIFHWMGKIGERMAEPLLEGHQEE